MKAFTSLFRIVHGLMAFLFACAALMLIIIASRMGWVTVPTILISLRVREGEAGQINTPTAATRNRS